MNRLILIIVDAYQSFNDSDGWALASHVALSVLLALFPFLIFVTAVAGLIGSYDLADGAAELLLDTWPDNIAQPIANQIRSVLTSTRSDALTWGAVLAIWFASSGIEALRVALNRAYGLSETRPWWKLRFESCLFVVLGAGGLLIFSFLIVLYPLIWAYLVKYAPRLEVFHPSLEIARYAVAGLIVVSGLVIAHFLLPARRKPMRALWPGVICTMVLWLVVSGAYGQYLLRFAANYVTMYAGLASFIIAVVYLYAMATIFIVGAELNASIARNQERIDVL